MLKDAFLVLIFHHLVCYGTYILVPFVLHYHLLTRDDCFLLAVPCFTPAFPGVLSCRLHRPYWESLWNGTVAAYTAETMS